MSRKPKRPICPTCGERAARTETRYGVRNDCCGLRSWGGKPLVAAEVHAARRLFHEVFDPIWQQGQMRRGLAYVALQTLTGIPLHECHGNSQTDVAKLKALTDAARKIRGTYWGD